VKDHAADRIAQNLSRGIDSHPRKEKPATKPKKAKKIKSKEEKKKSQAGERPCGSQGVDRS